MDEIWVLGATGRTGRALAARLQAGGAAVVLVGRDGPRLQALAAGLPAGGVAPRVVAGGLEATLGELSRSGAAVVVNTVGPFTATAVPVVRACPPGTHYVDVSNELRAVQAVLDLHDQAVVAGSTLVPGAGFGVVASESAVLHACLGRPAPARVRVDAVATVALESGTVGEALAATVLGGVPDGGRRVAVGRLVGDRPGSAPLHLTTPDGDRVVTGSAPTAELLTAWRASGADDVVAASSAVPTGRLARLALPVAAAVLRVPALSRWAVRRLARVRLSARPASREHSWARAEAVWASGERREVWLRAGDGTEFTTAAAAEVALRLARGEAAPGAGTPGALFGTDLALAAGGGLVEGASTPA